MKNLIVLDIDGVLNDHKFWYGNTTIKPECADILNEIIYITNPLFVISSAWRYMVLTGSMTVKGFENLLRTHRLNMEGRIIGVTPPDETIPTRGNQISRWFDENPRYIHHKYLVIDDIEFDIKLYHPYYKVDGTTGLTYKDEKKIIEYFHV